MLDILTKYERNGSFVFRRGDSLSQVCNAPNNVGGVYLVYALVQNVKELIYVGISGRIETDGSIVIRKAGLGGMKDRIVNGHQFGKISRKRSWPKQMELDGISALEINWFVTHSDSYCDSPRMIEQAILSDYSYSSGKLPRWNKKI